MKKNLILLFITILVSCSEDESKIQLIKMVNSLETENSTVNLNNKNLLKEFKSCNQIISELRLEKNSHLVEIKKEVVQSNKKLIGKWKTPTLYGGGNLTIDFLNGLYYKTETFPDNSFAKDEVILSIVRDNKIFRIKSKNTTDHWVVLKNGKLEVRDKDGLIYISEPLN